MKLTITAIITTLLTTPSYAAGPPYNPPPEPIVVSPCYSENLLWKVWHGCFPQPVPVELKDQGEDRVTPEGREREPERDREEPREETHGCE